MRNHLYASNGFRQDLFFSISGKHACMSFAACCYENEKGQFDDMRTMAQKQRKAPLIQVRFSLFQI